MLKTHKFQSLAVILAICVIAAPPVFGKVDLKPARTMLDEGRFQDVVDYLIEAQKDESRNIDLFKLLGDAYTGLGDLENAKDAYERALKIKSGDKEARLKLGDALIALGKTDEAVKVLEKGLSKAKKDPEKAAFNNAIGRALTAAENCSDAQQYLLKATIQDEENLDYRVDLGQAYYDCQVYSLAKIEYQAVLRADSNNCMAWYRIGFAQFRDRAFNDARNSFEQAYLCDTTFIPVYYDLALLYVLSARSQRGEQAEEYYRNALYYFERYRSEWPDSNKVLVAKNISRAYYQLHAYEQAVEELSRAIDEVGVDDLELLFHLARSLQLLGRYADAVERFSQYEAGLTDADTASAEFYNRRGICRYAMTFDDSVKAADTAWLNLALSDLKKAIELDSTDARSISIVGTLLSGNELKLYEESKWYFDRLTEMFPGEARYWYNAARVRLILKQEMEAVDFLFQAMATDTTAEGKIREAARESASGILLNKGQWGKARTMLEGLIAQEPNNCDHKLWYAYTFFVVAPEKEEAAQPLAYQKALPYLERAYNCMKNRGVGPRKMLDITKWLAQTYTQLPTPNWGDARPLIEAGLKIDPNDAEFLHLRRIDDESKEIEYTPGRKAGGRK
jgi:tetratricopeptide (TPR) repeat protein